jgi:diguanylate cyclase (GGDEF)-like protein/PAS domain S-box-containing protein
MRASNFHQLTGVLRRRSTVQLLAVAAVVVFLVLTVVHVGNSPGWTAFADVFEALAAVLATIACAVRAHRERSACSPAGARAGRGWVAWTLVACGAGAWALGQIGWCVDEVALHVTPPSPSVLDIGFLAFPALVVAGLLTMVQTPAGRLSQLRGAAEGLLLAAGCFLLSWSLIIGRVLATTNSSALGEVVNLAYPGLDAVALSAVVFVALRRRDQAHTGLGLLGAGIVCMALSDSAYWYVTAINPAFPGVSPFGTGWVAGFLLIALAALEHGGRRRSSRSLSAGRVVHVAPVLPASVGMLAVLVGWLGGGDLGSVGALVAIMGVVVAVAISLLVIVTYENRALTGDLERRVRERTAELHATERYYRALVEHSSDVIVVVGRDLRIRYVSDSVLDVFGHRPADLTGRGLDGFGHEAAKTLTQALERTALAAGQTSRVRWTLDDANGRIREAESTVTNLLADPDVEAFVLNTRDETDRVALEGQLREQAFHDPLTGLSNRALLNDRATQAVARSLRSGATVAVIVVDLDAFKLVNDSLGHEAGDALLRDVAQRLQSVVRPDDTLARIGADEFVLLLDAIGSADEAKELAQRLRGAVSHRLELDSGALGVTASIGVAIGVAAEKTFDDLLREADLAMCSVKAGGKDAVQLFDAGMHQQARERLGLQADLAKALERGELWLLYQPEFDVVHKRLQVFEALIRWNHPRRGLLPPDQFIALAEESGTIVALGRWVLREALGQLAAWDRLGAADSHVCMSVNVSAVQLKAPSLVDDVRAALERSGVDPERVILEITESSLVEDSHRVIGALHALKQLGVRIAIDDFGTGYASLSYLRSMPVDILKIDQAFVQASDDGQRGHDLLEAIVNIARSLSLQTVAEGVEQPEQLAAVRRMGCDLVQGYLLGRPVPVEEAQRMIAQGSALAGGSRSPLFADRRS